MKKILKITNKDEKKSKGLQPRVFHCIRKSPSHSYNLDPFTIHHHLKEGPPKARWRSMLSLISRRKILH